MMFTKGKVYSFTTKYPLVLGANHKNLKVLTADATSELARAYGDLIIRHSKIQASSDASDPIRNVKVEELSWVIFLNPTTNETLALASDYIEDSSISEAGTNLTFRVDGVSEVDRGVIKKLLNQHGYSVVVVE